MIRWTITILLLLSSVPLFAQYKSHAQGYCPPTYKAAVAVVDAKSYPTYSDWSWSVFPTDSYYFIRQRWVWTAADAKALEDDGWLYVKTHDGYTKALLKGNYGQQIGNAVYGYDPFRYYAAQVVHPKVAIQLPPTVIHQTPLPEPDKVADILGDPLKPTDVGAEYNYKAMVLLTQASNKANDNNFKLQAMKLDAHRELANKTHAANVVSQVAALLREQYALAEGAAKVGAQAATEAEIASIPVKNRQSATLIASRCLLCHGGAKGVAANIDFRLSDQFTRQTWRWIINSAESGRMPLNDEPRLTKEEVETLDSFDN